MLLEKLFKLRPCGNEENISSGLFIEETLELFESITIRKKTKHRKSYPSHKWTVWQIGKYKI